MWAKLDDSFFEHPKAVAVTPTARLLFLASLAHSAKHLTDGVIATGYLPTIRASAGASKRHVDELVKIGLWEDHLAGYFIHDWLDYNPPAERVLAKRAAAKLRMSELRSREQPSEHDANVQDEQGQAVHARRRAIPVTRIPSPVAPDGAAAAPSDKPKRIRSSSKNEPLYECNPVLAELANLYENEVASISPGIDAELRDWCERIPDNERGHAGIQYAFRESAAQGKRTWKYIAAILARLEAADWPADPGAVGPLDGAEADWLERRYERAKGEPLR